MQIDKHYARKETLIFSYMEKYGITAPPKVMWGVDDDIRVMIKALNELLASEKLPIIQSLSNGKQSKTRLKR